MRITDLINKVEAEAIRLNYNEQYLGKMKKVWNAYLEWANGKDLEEFTVDDAKVFLETNVKTGRRYNELKENEKFKICSIYKLISYYENGEFLLRIPLADPVMIEGENKESIESFIEFKKDKSKSYRDSLKNYMCRFNRYLINKGYTLDDLSVQKIDDFYRECRFSPSQMQDVSSKIRGYLKYSYENGYSSKDCSWYVMPVSKNTAKKLPTTYTDEEIIRLCSSVERCSAIGKRDYVIILLAVLYGLRASDIRTLTFDDIDWDNSTIKLFQEKTDYPQDFPLLAVVGNAIIDYVDYGRPKTEAREIIVSHESNFRKGRPLTSPTLHSVVTKYFNKAGVSTENKKHGPHALRHSIATNMLSKNISIPVIKTVLGHQRTETTMIYLSLDEQKLKRCALAVPSINTEVKGGAR